MYQICVHISDGQCKFSPVSPDACPDTEELKSVGFSDVIKMKKCTLDMKNGEQCRARGPLPDGNRNHDVDNCCGDVYGHVDNCNWDIFQCDKGTY